MGNYAGLDKQPACPENRQRDRPDSDSSDGDEPPLRRPRQAGFIVWPLAAILALCVAVVAVWAAKYQTRGSLAERRIAQQTKSGSAQSSPVGGGFIADISEDGEKQLLPHPSVIVSFAKNKQSRLIRALHIWRERGQAVGFVRSCIIWFRRQFDSLGLADRAVDQPAETSPAIPERDETGDDPVHVWAELDANFTLRDRHYPRTFNAPISRESGIQYPRLYESDYRQSGSEIIESSVRWNDYVYAGLWLVAGFGLLALGCTLWIDWDCWVGGVPLLLCGYVCVQTAEFTARYGWGDVWKSWAWLWTRGA
jgi:hypothetical protein